MEALNVRVILKEEKIGRTNLHAKSSKCVNDWVLDLFMQTLN